MSCSPTSALSRLFSLGVAFHSHPPWALTPPWHLHTHILPHLKHRYRSWAHTTPCDGSELPLLYPQRPICLSALAQARHRPRHSSTKQCKPTCVLQQHPTHRASHALAQTPHVQAAPLTTHVSSTCPRLPTRSHRLCFSDSHLRTDSWLFSPIAFTQGMRRDSSLPHPIILRRVSFVLIFTVSLEYGKTCVSVCLLPCDTSDTSFHLTKICRKIFSAPISLLRLASSSHVGACLTPHTRAWLHISFKNISFYILWADHSHVHCLLPFEHQGVPP